jgi:HPr kinase/phosphorylase
MTKGITPAVLFESHQEKLRLVWIAGKAGAERPLTGGQPPPRGSPFVGWVDYLSLINPSRVQIIGPEEMTWLGGLTAEAYAATLRRIFAGKPACVIVSDGQPVPDKLVAAAETAGIPLFGTQLPGYTVVGYLRHFLTDAFAERVTMHGVFLSVLDIGVLLIGKSGIGKSELALELLSRHHKLIADDAPEFRRIAPTVLRGFCSPSDLSGYLEVRGLGVLDIRAMFGDSAIKQSKNLRLVIELQRMDEKELEKIDRLNGSQQHRVILDVDVPQITLPVMSGRNLAVMVESAVSNHILMMKGLNATREFLKAHQKLLRDDPA